MNAQTRIRDQTRTNDSSKDAAFKKAVLKGISLFAASGDHGATDNSSDGRFTADFPASDPYVTGCGGTELKPDGKEVVWNDGTDDKGASGGGASRIFDLPEFQQQTDVPKHQGKSGRGVPDVAGDAAPGSGYKIRVRGSEFEDYGTSAVAPLYAALVMRINGALGYPVGYLNPFFYKHSGDGIFKDIIEGNNNGYEAVSGWDAATGWGSINGEKLLDALRRYKNNA